MSVSVHLHGTQCQDREELAAHYAHREQGEPDPRGILQQGLQLLDRVLNEHVISVEQQVDLALTLFKATQAALDSNRVVLGDR
ncbi:hypothetical protein OC846_002702, partial [Tilletia horrida]